MPYDYPLPAWVIAEKMRRQQIAADMDRDICRRCFQTDHNRRHCNQLATVACAICFRQNVFTAWCCARGNREEIAGQRQVFRFAGSPPRAFVDVNVMTMNVPGLFDPGSLRSRIDYRLAEELKTFQVYSDTPNCFGTPKGMSVTIGIRGTIIYIDCLVTELEHTVHLEWTIFH
ncbi:hypothetical protein ACFFRR_002833 [Megaselia abdita]